MQKGDTVILKNGHEATYVGVTSHNQRIKKHLIKLQNGEHKELVYGTEFFTQQDVAEMQKQKQIDRETAKVAKQNSPETIKHKIDQLNYKISELEEQKEEIFKEQDSEVGGLEGGTDEFEATGRHDIYGRRLNAIDRKINTIRKQINQLKGEPEEVYEAIDLLEKLTKTKVSFKD